RLFTGELGVAQERRNLEQGKRISSGRSNEPFNQVRRQLRLDRPRDQLLSLDLAEAAQRELLEPGLSKGTAFVVAHGEEERDPFRVDPASGKQQRLEGRGVEPLSLVDYPDDRPPLCERRE